MNGEIMKMEAIPCAGSIEVVEVELNGDKYAIMTMPNNGYRISARYNVNTHEILVQEWSISHDEKFLSEESRRLVYHLSPGLNPSKEYFDATAFILIDSLLRIGSMECQKNGVWHNERN